MGNRRNRLQCTLQACADRIVAQVAQTELERVEAGSVSEFVYERLHCEAVGEQAQATPTNKASAARRAKR